MEAETARLQKGMRLASTESRKFGKSLQDGIARHAPAIRATGMAIAGVGAAMTAVAALSIKSAADFGAELANVSTMLDDISMNLMPSYAEGLREMSKEFGESTDTLSKGLYDILSASIAPTKALDVLAVSAKLAAAGLTDTGVAADAITTIINSFGMAAEDAGRISDWMFAVVKKGKLTMAELAPSVGKVAATASIAGVSLEELGASIATITRAGIRSQEAMTAINGILRAFLKPTDDATKAARDFGFELNTTTLRTIGLQGVIKLLETATAEQTAAMFPNIRGLKGIAAAMKDVEGYARDYDLMLNSAGLTQEAFAKQSDIVAFAFGQLKMEFADIIRALGLELIPIIKKDFIPAVRELAEKLQGLVKWFGELPEATKKFALELGPLLTVMGGMVILLPTLTNLIATLGTTIGLATAAVTGGVGAVVLLWVKWEEIWAKYAASVFAAIIPIVKIIKGTGGFIPALKKLVAYNEFAGRVIVDAWQVLGQNMVNWVVWIAVNTLSGFNQMHDNILSIITRLMDNIGNQIEYGIALLKSLFTKEEIERPNWEPILHDVEWIFTEIPKLVGIGLEEAREKLNATLKRIDERVEETGDVIIETSSQIVTALDDVTNAGEVVAEVFKMLPVRIHAIEGELASLNEELKDAGEIYVPTLSEELAILRERLGGIGAQADVVAKIFKMLPVEIHAISGELADVNERLKNAGEVYVPTLSEELAILRERLRGIGVQADVVEKEFEMLPVRISSVQGELASLNEDLKAAGETYVPTLSEELAILRERLGGIGQKADVVAKKFKMLPVRISAVQGELASLNEELKDAGEVYVPTLSEELAILRKRLGGIGQITKVETAKAKDAWKKFWDDMEKMAEGFVDGVTDSFEKGISEWIKVGGMFENAWKRIIQSLADAWVNQFVAKLMKIQPFIGIINILSGLFGGLSDMITKAVTSLWNLITATAAWIAKGLASVIVSTIQAIGGMAGAMAKLVWETARWIALNIKAAILAIVPIIGSLALALWGLVSALGAAILQLVAWIWMSIKAAAAAVFEWFCKLIPLVGWIAGIAAAALAYAAIKALIGFEKGGLVSSYQQGGIVAGEEKEGVLVRAHPGELILPKEMADWLREALASPGPMAYTPAMGGEGITPGAAERRIIIEQHVEIKSLFPPDDPIIYRRVWRQGMRAAYEEDEDRRSP